MQQSSIFHGNKILGLAIYSQLISMGCSVYIFGLFIEPVSETFGASRGTIGWGPTIMFLTSSSLAPLIGRWIEKGKVKKMMLCGGILLAAGLCLLSLTTQLWQMAIILSLMVGLGVGFLGPLPCSALVVHWFQRRRGFALGLSATGASLGGFLLPIVTAMLISNIGWQQCLLILGVAIALTLVPAVWFLAVNKPSDIGQFPDGDSNAAAETSNVDTHTETTNEVSTKQILSTPNFWFIGLTISLINGAGAFCITYIVPFATELGVATEFSALLISILAGCALAGKFILGHLCDRIDPRTVLLIVVVGFMAGWSQLILTKQLFSDSIEFGLVTACVIAGLSLGGLLPAWNTLVAKVYGQEIFARVLGFMYLLSTPFILMPGPLGGYGYDLYNSYLPILKAGWFIFPVMLLFAFFIAVPGHEKKPATSMANT